VKYIIQGLHKFAEQDSWEHGCLPDTATDSYIDASFSGDTKNEVLQKVADFLCCSMADIERDACDEIGRVDFAVTETDEGYQLGVSDMAAWVKGELRAWYCVYSGHLQQVKTVSAVD
jgi:hypothetical protein